jgi:hypothetical protein
MAPSLDPEDIRVLHGGTVVRPFDDGYPGDHGRQDGDLSDDDDWDLWDNHK